jgi:predicted ABC-type ATPase
LERIRHLVAARQSFTWETTMSGRTAIRWLKDAKAAGYRVKGYFLWVREVEMTLLRIRRRVAEGGHNIESEVARRRFYKTLQNFLEFYRPVFDSWRLFENDGPAPRLLAVDKNGRLALRDPKRFERVITQAGIDL